MNHSEVCIGALYISLVARLRCCFLLVFWLRDRDVLFLIPFADAGGCERAKQRNFEMTLCNVPFCMALLVF